jgi:hypothetical protein
VTIRHSASTVNRSSPPLEILKMAHVQGGDCFCLRYLLSDESWRIELTQKAMEMDFCVVFCAWVLGNTRFIFRVEHDISLVRAPCIFLFIIYRTFFEKRYFLQKSDNWKAIIFTCEIIINNLTCEIISFISARNLYESTILYIINKNKGNQMVWPYFDTCWNKFGINRHRKTENFTENSTIRIID